MDGPLKLYARYLLLDAGILGELGKSVVFEIGFLCCYLWLLKLQGVAVLLQPYSDCNQFEGYLQYIYRTIFADIEPEKWEKMVI